MRVFIRRKRLHCDLLENFIEIIFGKDQLRGIDQADQLPALQTQLVDFPREFQPLRRLGRHIDQTLLVRGAERIDRGGIDIEQADDLAANLDRHGHLGARPWELIAT